MGDLVLLPDGRVFLCNGGQVGELCHAGLVSGSKVQH